MATGMESEMHIGEVIETVGQIVDALGVFAIVLGVAYAIADAAIRGIRKQRPVYTRFRRVLGRAILVGLELLVAADIIKTVAVTPTLESLAVLSIIVLIRTFLSWSLELEISGRWPWQKPTDATKPEPVPGPV
ncbi:putative membrane protein [Mycetocola sp. 2940]